MSAPDKPTEPSRDYPWTPFKMKIFLHCAQDGSSRYNYLATLAPLVIEKSQRSREQSYRKVIKELLADGLISPTDPDGKYYSTTPRGRVYADYLLSRALPEQTAPRWVMPAR